MTSCTSQEGISPSYKVHRSKASQSGASTEPRSPRCFFVALALAAFNGSVATSRCADEQGNWLTICATWWPPAGVLKWCHGSNAPVSDWPPGTRLALCFFNPLAISARRIEQHCQGSMQDFFRGGLAGDDLAAAWRVGNFIMIQSRGLATR